MGGFKGQGGFYIIWEGLWEEVLEMGIGKRRRRENVGLEEARGKGGPQVVC